MQTRFVVAVTVAVALWAAPTLAHEGGVDSRGTVRSVDTDRITVVVQDGGERSFALTPATRIMVGRASARPEDIKAGMRVVVHARRNGERLEAVVVRAAGKGPP